MNMVGQAVHRGQRYVITDKEIGELSRHWLRWRADRAAARANGRREVPSAEYRVVRQGRRYLVIAFQNLAVSS